MPKAAETMLQQQKTVVAHVPHAAPRAPRCQIVTRSRTIQSVSHRSMIEPPTAITLGQSLQFLFCLCNQPPGIVVLSDVVSADIALRVPVQNQTPALRIRQGLALSPCMSHCRPPGVQRANYSRTAKPSAVRALAPPPLHIATPPPLPTCCQFNPKT